MQSLTKFVLMNLSVKLNSFHSIKPQLFFPFFSLVTNLLLSFFNYNVACCTFIRGFGRVQLVNQWMNRNLTSQTEGCVGKKLVICVYVIFIETLLLHTSDVTHTQKHTTTKMKRSQKRDTREVYTYISSVHMSI